MTATKLPSTEVRLARLEDAFVQLVAWSTDNQRSRLERSISAPTSGLRLGEFLDTIAAEADLREKAEPE
jgi:hypothetical protein